MGDPKTVNLQGEGSAVFEFTLPLSEANAELVKQGKLKPADEDAQKALDKAGIEEEVQETVSPEPETSEPPSSEPPPKVGKGSGRDAWAKYAESVGVETEGANRAEIIKAVEAKQK